MGEFVSDLSRYLILSSWSSSPNLMAILEAHCYANSTIKIND